MQKIPLRPLRLVRLHDKQLEHSLPVTDGSDRLRGLHTPGVNSTVAKQNRKVPEVTGKAAPSGESEARQLLRQTPNNYIFNQIYGLWLYLSLFLLTIIITRTVSKQQYGDFAAIQTAINTILYIVALGLEDATATFAPRLLAEYGHGSAASLIRRLLTIRLGVVMLSMVVIIFGLPLLAMLIEHIPIEGSASVAAGLRDPVLLSHTWPVAVYVLGTGITNLLMAVCAAQMRMQRVLIIGLLSQSALLGLGYVALRIGWQVNGVLWMQALVSVLSAVAFLAWLSPLLLTKKSGYKQPIKPVLQLGISAWLTNLVSGALLKQTALILLLLFTAALANTAIAYFNLAFQLADATNVLLVAGFSGVGASALAAAFVGNNSERLARSWQALIKVETLLAAPGLIFCLFNAQNIATTLYGSQFESVGPLLAIFLFFNLLVRVTGTTIHQSSLYVIGKARWVVASQWGGLLILILVGVALVPGLGAAGALIADGIARLITGMLMLFVLLRTLPRKYPRELLGFTLRFLLALFLAALPSILWHPTNRILLGVSGGLFLVLCVALLFVIKPLSAADLDMIGLLNPRIAPFLRGFARK